MTTRMPQPIPYQGSKRNIAPPILSFFSSGIDTLIEPFAGSAALSIRAAFEGRANWFHLNDVNTPLMHLMEKIIFCPGEIAREYEQLWHEQQGDPRGFYDEVRSNFNQTHQPAHFLYLLARCVKASVRYNNSGEFNQGPDNRRLGRRPESMSKEIYRVSALLKDRTKITKLDYRETISQLNSETDLVYMDPPYQGTSNGRDGRYVSGICVREFTEFLHSLNEMGVMYIVSYDGRKGEKTYGRTLPDCLHLQRLEVNAGPSAQSTLLGKRDVTIESLYLSPALTHRLNNDGQNPSPVDHVETGRSGKPLQQLELGCVSR